MLTQVCIRDFALIDALTLEFAPGFNVISGETGAGKSLLFSALGLITGERSDGDWVRTDAEKADLSMTVDLSHVPQAYAWLAEQDLLEPMDTALSTECIIRRVIRRDGRSRAYINGIPTSIANLKQLGVWLIQYHSQHQHAQLTTPSNQLAWYDQIVGADQHLLDLAEACQQLQAVERDRDRIQALLTQAQSQRGFIEYQLQEFEAIADDLAQLGTLEQQLKQDKDREDQLAVAHQATGLLALNDASCASHLSQVLDLLEPLLSRQDSLKDIVDMLNIAHCNVQEASDALARLAYQSSDDSIDLEQLEARLSQIYQIARKHRVQPEKLIEVQAEFQQTLSKGEQLEEKLVELNGLVLKCQADYTNIAEQLTQTRLNGQAKFEKAVIKGLGQLGLRKSAFKVAFQSVSQQTTSDSFFYSTLGNERLEFLFSPNQGHDLKPVQKIASGGELSRLNLVLQVQSGLGKKTQASPVYLFDEIDVGVSSEIAKVMGSMIKDIAKRTQVFCITHSAQVAAQAEVHWFAHKAFPNTPDGKKNQGMVSSRWVQLDSAGRTQELARLVGDTQLEIME